MTLSDAASHLDRSYAVAAAAIMALGAGVALVAFQIGKTLA